MFRIVQLARRYERYDRCDIANELYPILLQKEPERVFILRKITACYTQLGQVEMAEKP